MPEQIYPGRTLPSVVRHITQEKIRLYAEASGDFNPIHIDESFAAQTPFGGTIAHGMLVLAYVSEMMTLAFGQNWLSQGKLRARFREAARPGDTLTVQGRVDSVEQKNGISYANCSFECCNQKGEIVISGDVVVKLPSGEKEDASR